MFRHSDIVLESVKDEHVSMPHPEYRRCSRTRVQTQRIAGRYDTSSSLSAKHVPTRTWPRSQVTSPPRSLLSHSHRFARRSMPVPPEVDCVRLFMIVWRC